MAAAGADAVPTPEGLALCGGEAVLVEQYAISALLVGAAFNGTLAFYEGKTLVPSGRPVTAGRSWASSLAFSDDGRELATVALDSSARLFDVERREQVGSAFDAGIDTAAVLRPDGLALALDPPDGQWTGAVAWGLDPEAWREAACLEAGRNLTRAEWEQYIGGVLPGDLPGLADPGVVSPHRAAWHSRPSWPPPWNPGRAAETRWSCHPPSHG